TTDKQFFGTKTEILQVAVKTETIQEWKKWMQVYIEKNELSLNDNQDVYGILKTNIGAFEKLT
ncbi:MAG: hypothetical protein ACRDAO_08275, partial [Culicoidibacterales bacterium]